MNETQDKTPENRGGKLLLWGLGVSFLLHLLFLLSQMSWFDFGQSESFSDKNTPIEITEAPPEPPPPPAKVSKPEAPKSPPVRSKEKEIVETEDAKNRKVDPNAKFLSEHDQTADKQMKAKAIDDFRTKQGTGAKNQPTDAHDLIPPTAQEQKPQPAKPIEPETAQGVGEAEEKPTPKSKTMTGVKRDWKTLSLKDLSVGGDGNPMAATDDRVSGVDEGDRTVLSTREFKYFSYYRRIKDLLRQYWKPMVEEKMYKMWNRGRTVSADELTTQLLVLLNTNGGIQKISRVSSSGITDLDDAAIEAFQRAAPFPNPPKGMIDADGFVRIRWDFILRAESGPMIQFRNAGGPPTN